MSSRLFLCTGYSYAPSYIYNEAGQKRKTLLHKMVHTSPLTFACCKDEQGTTVHNFGKGQEKNTVVR